MSVAFAAAQSRWNAGRTICEAFWATVEREADRSAFSTAGGQTLLTWRQYGERVAEIAPGLDALGVRAGDMVGLLLTNRVEFHLVDMALLQLGAVPFSLYNTSPTDDLAWLLRDAGARVLVTEAALAPAALAARELAPALEHVVSVDEAGARVVSLMDLPGPAAAFDLDGCWRRVEPSDVATVIYTSGSTGTPKGARLSHENLLSMASAYADVLPTAGEVISYLPMAHVAERLFTQYLPAVSGFTTTPCPDVRLVMDFVRRVRPLWFFAPPRTWEQLRSSLTTAIADHERRAEISIALDLGREKVRCEQRGGRAPAAMLAEYDDLAARVLRPILADLGMDRLRFALTGTAPVPPELLEFFMALGVPLVESYGLSECGQVAMNPPGRARLGTVGLPPRGVELRIAGDGEILVRGPSVMLGYHGSPEQTEEAIDADGWFHTGDIGELDEHGYLRVVDRKKDLIVTSSGKNISPARVESALRAAGTCIGQVCVVGEGRPFLVALVTPDPVAVAALVRSGALPPLSERQLLDCDELTDVVWAQVQAANAHLARPEQVRAFALLPEWGPGGDEVTASMKLRRTSIEFKYRDQIDSMYP